MHRVHPFELRLRVLFLLLAVEIAFSFLQNPTIPACAASVSIRRSYSSALSSESSIQPVPLTVIIPAFNEVGRIGPTLSLYSDYFVRRRQELLTTNVEEGRSPSLFSSVQILVVDDGSTDGMVDLINSELCLPNVDCISLPVNQGKGAAVAFGVLQLVKQKHEGLLLVADADGSANIECLEPMMNKLIETIQNQSNRDDGSSSFWSTPAIVVGNRGSASSNDESSSSKKTIILRSILRWGFRTTVRIFLVGHDLGGVRDTQCGFKLMTVAAAGPLYRDLNLQRWTHDVEVLFRASKNNVAVAEQDIEWEDKEGSKLVEGLGGVAGTSMTMLLQVLQMRLAYELGIWQ